MNNTFDDENSEAGEEAFEAAVQETIAQKRESFEDVDDALGSLDTAAYLEQSGLVLAALRTESDEAFSPEALQAIGQFLCDKVLEKLEEYAKSEVEDILKL
jgi:hypothetical protein